MTKCSLFCICLAWCSLSFLDLCFGINLGQIFSHYHFNYFLYSFFFPTCYYHCVCSTFCSCPKVLRYTFFFPLCFSVLEVSIEKSSSSENLSLAMSSLLINPSKAFFIYAIVVFISSISFWLFLNIFTLLPVTICCCLPFSLFIGTLSISITVATNSRSDLSNILVVSNSDACSV